MRLHLVIVEDELFARLLRLTTDALQPINVLHGHVGQQRKVCRVPPGVVSVEYWGHGVETYQRHI